MKELWKKKKKKHSDDSEKKTSDIMQIVKLIEQTYIKFDIQNHPVQRLN